jgi:hypothetical protein
MLARPFPPVSQQFVFVITRIAYRFSGIINQDVEDIMAMPLQSPPLAQRLVGMVASDPTQAGP